MWVLAALTFAATCPADTTGERRADLDRAIEAYVNPFGVAYDRRNARIGWADVSGDGHEDALVLLHGPGWCGSSGCTLLVAEAMVHPEDAAEWGPFRIAAEVSNVNPPVHVARRRGAWHDLVATDGFGALRVLRFTGETYPLSPADGRLLLGAKPPGVTLFVDAR